MTQEKKEEAFTYIEKLLTRESELIALKKGNEERIARVEPSKDTCCINCGSQYHMQRECPKPEVPNTEWKQWKATP